MIRYITEISKSEGEFEEIRDCSSVCTVIYAILVKIADSSSFSYDLYLC